MAYPPDKIIVNGCLKGDTAMQRALFEKHKVPMFRICLRYAGSREEAEDLLQEGFIKVFGDLKNYRNDGPLGAWMRKVVVNTCLMHLRRQKDRMTSVSLEEAATFVETDERILQKLDAEVLTRLIQQLPPGYRTVFNLFVLDGFSHKEIADQLDISESTSKTQLHKAKATLKVLLERFITV